jgi:hypothetical protein
MRTKLTLGLAMAVGLIVAATAFSAINARLEGSFATKAKIVSSNYAPGSVGSTVHRTYKFTPKCDVGPCFRVVFKRQTSSGHFIHSRLHRTAPGVYDGTERVKGAFCEKHPGHGPVRLKVRHHVRIVKAVDGNATKIKGRSNYRLAHHCGRQRAKWVGTLG